MKTLLIDTSLNDSLVAVMSNGVVLLEKRDCTLNKHSKYLVSDVKEVMDNCSFKPKDVDNIMVVNGPGSFTGIRIGLTFAKIYGYLLEKNVITFSSLKCLAMGIEGNYIMSLIDARNDNYYIGLYDKYYNDVIDEFFGSSDDVINLYNKYEDLLVVSNSEINIVNMDVRIVNYNLERVFNYYKNNVTVNVHLIDSNYLKLPQVLEKKC